MVDFDNCVILDTGSSFTAISNPEMICNMKQEDLFIEMKTPQSRGKRDSGLSAAQKRVHKQLFDLGQVVFVCFDLEHFKQLINGWQSICSATPYH